ncbi:MAG: PAS/PAC sensor hybrid histidine kinase, partial [uncultured Blastococcus sp.]
WTRSGTSSSTRRPLVPPGRPPSGSSSPTTRTTSVPSCAWPSGRPAAPWPWTSEMGRRRSPPLAVTTPISPSWTSTCLGPPASRCAPRCAAIRRPPGSASCCSRPGPPRTTSRGGSPRGRTPTSPSRSASRPSPSRSARWRSNRH